MRTTNKTTRREALIGGAAFLMATAVLGAPAAKRPGNRWARACWQAWRGNGYRPQLLEVEQWLACVKEHDKILFDLESLGDPTFYSPRDGHTRGLGSVKLAAASDVCRAEHQEIEHLGTALFVPAFNIRVMIRHFEGPMARSPMPDRVQWALVAYNAGEEKTLQRYKRGIFNDGYSRSHGERLRKLKNLLT